MLIGVDVLKPTFRFQPTGAPPHGSELRLAVIRKQQLDNKTTKSLCCRESTFTIASKARAVAQRVSRPVFASGPAGTKSDVHNNERRASVGRGCR